MFLGSISAKTALPTVVDTILGLAGKSSSSLSFISILTFILAC